MSGCDVGWVGSVPAGAWVACLDSRADRDARGVVRDRQLPAAFCVDVSHDRTMAYIAVAFWDSEGRRRVELAAQRLGLIGLRRGCWILLVLSGRIW